MRETFLDDFRWWVGVYTADACLAGEPLNPLGFREFADDGIAQNVSLIRTVAADTISRVLGQTEDPAGCLAPYLFAESGLEGELTTHLLGAWYVLRLHPFYRESAEGSLRTAAYSWFDSGSSVSLLSRLCGIYNCPEYEKPLQIVAGFYHTCALLEGGTVRCWGNGSSGQLGYGNTYNIGDDETPASAGDVDIF